MSYTEIQLGKSGISENFVETLRSHFKNHWSVRVAVLKSAGHDKAKVKEYSEEILKMLNSRPRTANNKNNLLPTTKSLGEKHYTAKLIGFKIILKKWRKEKRN